MKNTLTIILILLTVSLYGQLPKPTGLTSVPTYSLYYNRTDSLPAIYKGTVDLWNYLATPPWVNKTFLQVNQQYPQSVINGSPIMEGIQFDTTPTTTNVSEGLLRWNATDGTLDLGQGLNGIVTQQIGQEIFIKVVNKSGTTINEGKAVYFDGRLGNRPKIKLAKGDAVATSMVTGIVTEDIANNAEGYITSFGYVRKIKTDYATWAEGDKLYVSTTTAGSLTNVAPSAPHHSDCVGSVGIVHSNLGSIFVSIQRHQDLTDLADVDGTPLTTTGQVPVWNQDSLYFDFDWTLGQAAKKDTSAFLTSRAITSTSHYTGFPDRTATSLGFNDGTYTLTLTATADPIWLNGVSYTINTLTKQLTVGQEAVTGLYWFWLTQTGNVVSLNCDISPPGFDKCLVATVYWNTTTNKGILSDERHWMGRDQWMHEYLHETVGARFASGMLATFADATFSVPDGEFYDEDIEHDFTTQTTAKVLYHNGDSDWAWDILTTPYKETGGELAFNTGNTLSAATANRYVNYWVYATGDVSHPINIVIGTAQYTTIDAARAAGVPALGSLVTAENKLIWKATYRNASGTPTFEEALDYRTASSVPSNGTTATDHGTLTGLTDLDHPATAIINTPIGAVTGTTVQAAINNIDTLFVKKAGTQTITGAKTFAILNYSKAGYGAYKSMISDASGNIAYSRALGTMAYKDSTYASMVYPAAPGIAVSTGTPPTAWGTSIADASTNWNTAYDERQKWNGSALVGGGTQSAARGSIGVNNTWATVNSDVQTLTVAAGAAAWNMNAGINAKVTLSGDVTITLSNLSINGLWGALTVTNDATARVITFAGYTNKIDPAVRSGANQITTSGGSKEDLIAWYWNGTSLSWFAKFDLQ